jgi:hypothetical protein
MSVPSKPCIRNIAEPSGRSIGLQRVRRISRRRRENQRDGAWANQIGEREGLAGVRAARNDPAAPSVERKTTVVDGHSVNRRNALTYLQASGFPQLLQQFIHRKFDSE